MRECVQRESIRFQAIGRLTGAMAEPKDQVSCLGCLRTFPLRLDGRQLRAWINGEDLIKVMPRLTKTQRALLVTGYCEKCFEKRFHPDEEHQVQ